MKTPVSRTLVALIASLAVFVGISIANGASWTSVSPWLIISGTDGTSPQPVKVDSSGAVNVTTAASGALTVGGPAVDDAAASGNPVPVGGIYNSTPPTYTNLDRTQLQFGSRGYLRIEEFQGSSGNVSSFLADNADAVAVNAAQQAKAVVSRNTNFNGATWDREFTCGPAVAISVAAASTTELVALSGSTVVRVCSFMVTGDTAATTVTFIDGTGSACATSPSNLTGAMRTVDEGNVGLSAANGSLFRTRAGRALCITAATGAVTGFVSYAQF